VCLEFRTRPLAQLQSNSAAADMLRVSLLLAFAGTAAAAANADIAQVEEPCVEAACGAMDDVALLQACEAGRCEEVEEVGLMQHQRFGPIKQDCITEKDMDATIDAFMGTVLQISKEANNCTAAKATALGALNAAYAYGVKGVTVQFKPTLTVAPHVYRPTQEGALSYFVGTCVCPGATTPEMNAPKGCGEKQGYYAPDSGFGFGSSLTTPWVKVVRGGTKVGGRPKTNFWFNTGGNFCHAATAQGPICFVDAAGETVCVDKTFGFVPNPSKEKGALRALLSTHHSSLQFSMEELAEHPASP